MHTQVQRNTKDRRHENRSKNRSVPPTVTDVTTDRTIKASIMPTTSCSTGVSIFLGGEDVTVRTVPICVLLFFARFRFYSQSFATQHRLPSRSRLTTPTRFVSSVSYHARRLIFVLTAELSLSSFVIASLARSLASLVRFRSLAYALAAYSSSTSHTLVHSFALAKRIDSLTVVSGEYDRTHSHRAPPPLLPSVVAPTVVMSAQLQPNASPQGSPQGSPHHQSVHAQAQPPPLDLAAELHSLQMRFAKQSADGNALLEEYSKVKAEKAALKQKLERGGASKMLQHAAKFTGQNGQPVEDWVDEIEKQQQFFHIAENEKVETAVMLLKGPAAHWWKTLVTKDEATSVWREFVEKMKEMFQPISSVDRARAALDVCVLGKRPVQSYIDSFRRLVQFLPDMSDADQRHRFTTNLSDALKLEVLKAKPKTLEEAIHAAVAAEAYGPQRSRVGYVPMGQYYSAPRYGGTPSNASGSTAMELNNIHFGDDEDDADDALGDLSPTALPPSDAVQRDAGGPREKHLLNVVKSLKAQNKIQASLLSILNTRGGPGRAGSRPAAAGARVPNVSKADYERCRKEGRCLNCKQKDHVARECPNPFKSNF